MPLIDVSAAVQWAVMRAIWRPTMFDLVPGLISAVIHEGDGSEASSSLMETGGGLPECFFFFSSMPGLTRLRNCTRNLI